MGVRGGQQGDGSPFLLEKLKTMREDFEGVQKELGYWRGKVHQQRQKFKVDGDYNLDDDSDVVSLAKSILPGFLDFLPKDVQDKAKGLLNNPDVIELFNEIYKKHPKEIKNLFGGFLKKGSIESASSKEAELEADYIKQVGGA